MIRTERGTRGLSSIGLFTGCTKRELATLERHCIAQTIDEGAVLSAEGSTDGDYYVIADGRAAVTIEGRRITTVGRGSCVGGTPSATTVTALTPMKVYAFSSRRVAEQKSA